MLVVALLLLADVRGRSVYEYEYEYRNVKGDVKVNGLRRFEYKDSANNFVARSFRKVPVVAT
eukprot:scaffold662757_cov92-Prasinocladus_malaysianus.AAC.1